MFETTDRFHRVPIGFGPAPTPRQGADGKPFPNWKSESELHTTGIVFDVGREELQALLPEGYKIDPDAQPTVLFEIMELRKLPWLAGRGYNTWGIYANDVICTRATDGDIKGSYMLVLFESFTDPITTGREELGFCKLFADLPDMKLEGGNLTHTASWQGYEFMRMEIPAMKEQPVEEAPSMKPRPFTMPSVEGVLHHRYVPAVGQPGKHDASYATFMPGEGSGKPRLRRYLTTTGSLQDAKVTIKPGTFEQLPTLWNVVEGLAALKLGKVREVARQEIFGASDCSKNKRVEW